MKKLIALRKVVETGSFTRAAEALGYTQSSLSQMIASLENEFSIKLLKRSRKGITLTQEGIKLYPYIQRSIQQFEAMEGMATEIKGLKTGIIRIGAIASISRYWLPSMIKEFQEQYPKINFILKQGDYTSIYKLIKEGQVDFGFLTPKTSGNLKMKIIKSGEMGAIVSSSHKMANKKIVRIEDLVKDPFILLEEGSYSEPLEAFKKALCYPSIKYRIHDDNTIMTMVEENLGISILSKLIMEKTNFNIVYLPIQPKIERIIGIAYQDEFSLPIASKYFINFILARKEKLK